MRLAKPLIKLLSFALLSHGISVSTHHGPIATIINGTLLGTHNLHYNQDFFLGVPYAQPPVGELRFHHPQPINQSWSVKDATSYGPWCHTSPLSLPGFTQEGFQHEESEDCLTLNIVRPSGINQDAALPVLVWIYGGGFRDGSGADQRYNMSFIVDESVQMGQPIIGVSFNYRLSGFGFLQGRAVDEAGIANLGLYDQRFALQWIQENIRAFGGDSSRVTIQGESGGAVSVGHHFLAYGGRDDGLFHAGIAQSGGPLMTDPFLSLDEQDILYDDILNKTGCIGAIDSIACLRAKPASTLKAAFQDTNYYPVLDGRMVTGRTSVALREGNFVKRPLLIGANTNEGTAFAMCDSLGVDTLPEFRTMVAESTNGDRLSNSAINAFADLYVNKLSREDAENDLGHVLYSPVPSYGYLYGPVTLYIGDARFNAPRRYTAELWANHGVPSYTYRFDAVPNWVPSHTLGATHFQEIPFVFRNFDGVGHEFKPLISNSTEKQQRYHDLSRAMSRMWVSFASTLSPNAHQVPGFNGTWPVYRNDSGMNIVFGLNGTYLEPDTWREEAIRHHIESFTELVI
ncbi:hypothetical protein BDW74DRAFT_57562 [Aspergillus multicolor]|uniref:carboxylesterase/lipase family protein n=1 Tax=Aspergillus multicolor TaxID=41759 RepID=UPI003CCD2475